MPRNAFPYPLRLDDLDEFTHPLTSHDLARPCPHDRDVFVGNTRIALRIHRGMWMASDFHEPAPEILQRFQKLPWHRFERMPDEWTPLSNCDRFLYRNAQIRMWDKDGRLSPSPIWRVNEIHLVRLSCLQLIGRLPRCEIFTGETERDDPIYFRFSGGIGLIPKERKLTLSSFEILRPNRCPLDGFRLKNQPRPTFQQDPNWPPPEPLD